MINEMIGGNGDGYYLSGCFATLLFSLRPMPIYGFLTSFFRGSNDFILELGHSNGILFIMEGEDTKRVLLCF